MTALSKVIANVSKHNGFAKLVHYRVILPQIRDAGVTNRIKTIGSDLGGTLGSIVGATVGREVSDRLPTADDVITMDMICRSVTLPGKTLNTIISRTNMRDVTVASGYTVDPVNLRWSETADYLVSKYIDRWLSIIVDPRTYEVGYRKDYTRDIVIVALDSKENPMYTVTLHAAYPKSKVLLDLSDFSANTVTEVAAVFDYEDYSVGTDHEQFAYELARVAGDHLNIPLNIINSII